MAVFSGSWLTAAMMYLLHPFFISLTEVNFNQKEKTVEVSVRIFTDDLEKSIRKNNAGNVDLLNKTQQANSAALLKNYIKAHVSLVADGKPLQMDFIGFETKEGSVWSYFEIPGIATVHSLEITDRILHEYQDKQVNFLHVKGVTSDETVKLDYPDTYYKFSVQ